MRRATSLASAARVAVRSGVHHLPGRNTRSSHAVKRKLFSVNVYILKYRIK